jgi:hypothetical protein
MALIAVGMAASIRKLNTIRDDRADPINPAWPRVMRRDEQAPPDAKPRSPRSQ